jgi:hypothetical protein
VLVLALTSQVLFWGFVKGDLAALGAKVVGFALVLRGLHWAASAYADVFAALPQPMDVAKGQGVQRTRLTNLQRCGDLVVSVDGALIRASDGLAVGRELEMAYLVSELFPFRVEVEGDPTDMVFGGVGMGDLFPQADLHLEELTRLHLIWGFDDWHVLLFLPVSFLDTFA